MKITINRLKIRNIGMIADTVVELNKPLICFYGEIRNGKTTILSSVRWVCGGAFPPDIIRHGQKDAEIELEFSGGSIRRSFYRNRDGETVSRAVQFIENGKPVKNPVTRLRAILNPFMLDQDYLRKMSDPEKKAYFLDLFQVDTKALDAELFNLKRSAETLRGKLEGYGEIDLTPVATVDVAALRDQMAKARQDHAAKVVLWQKELDALQREYDAKVAEVARQNRDTQRDNINRDRQEETKTLLVAEVDRLRKLLTKAESDLAAVVKWLEDNKKKEELPPLPVPPSIEELRKTMAVPVDVSELQAQIEKGLEQNGKAQQYLANKKRDEQRQADVLALKAAETSGRDIVKQKRAKLEEISATSGVPGLTFDDEGEFVFEGVTAPMLSTSQLMKLSSALSALYPDGLGIELLDRGESLGRSVFEYAQRAKDQQITVLAAIVGKRPATVPAEVGCFIVKDGVVFDDNEPAAEPAP